jgi:hypothetical protein
VVAHRDIPVPTVYAHIVMHVHPVQTAGEDHLVGLMALAQAFLILAMRQEPDRSPATSAQIQMATAAMSAVRAVVQKFAQEVPVELHVQMMAIFVQMIYVQAVLVPTQARQMAQTAAHVVFALEEPVLEFQLMILPAVR